MRRELTFKEDGQEYAQVIKMLGNGRLEAMCFDGNKRLATIRGMSLLHAMTRTQKESKANQAKLTRFFLPGKLRKKVWINQGDIILLSLRDYQDNKGDVILKYTADEARSLKAYGELPENAKINETDIGNPGDDGDCNFEFDEDRDSGSDDDGAPGGKEIEIDDI
jgi:translation initiation factor 1A